MQKNVHVFVVAQGVDGPEIFETDIELSESDYNHGMHYRIAQNQASKVGLDGPMTAFDEFDPAYRRFKLQTPDQIQYVLNKAKDIAERLVDSEAHAVDVAVPDIAIEAATLIAQMSEIVANVGKPLLEKAQLRRIAEQVVFSNFLSEVPENATMASIRETMAQTGDFPDGLVVAEIFEDLTEDNLFEAMSDLANSFEGAMEHAGTPEVIPSRVAVDYWEDVKPIEEREFFMEITDQRRSNAQMFVDIAPIQGDIDDILSLRLEINRLPGDETDRQCAHLHFDGDNLAVSIFKDGGGYILRPETDVRIYDTLLANGDLAWRIE